MVALGPVTRTLPGGGAVDVVHVEDPAVAVHPGLPVCRGGAVGGRGLPEISHMFELLLQFRSFYLIYYIFCKISFFVSDTSESCVHLQWRQQTARDDWLSAQPTTASKS